MKYMKASDWQTHGISKSGIDQQNWQKNDENTPTAPASENL
jgi:hypothetical protein